MNRILVAGLLTLAFPVFAAAAPEAPDLSAQFASATAMVDASDMNTYVDTRERPIGEKLIVAVGECQRYGNWNNTWSFKVSYKQLVELYQVEVSKGRGLFNWQHTEKIIPGSQTQALRQWFEEVQADDAGFDTTPGANCVRARALYLQLIPAK